jgi:hypothetical protein
LSREGNLDLFRQSPDKAALHFDPQVLLLSLIAPEASLFETDHDDEVVTMMMNVVTTVSMLTLDSTPAQSILRDASCRGRYALAPTASHQI